MCGRREQDRLFGDKDYGDIDFNLVNKVADELPSGAAIQFHNNGEGLLYPRFGEAVSLFKHCVRGIVTNGKLLVEKASEIVGNLNTLSVSIIENDPEADEQLKILTEFLRIKGDKLPFVTLRFVGNVDQSKYDYLGLLAISRTIHAAKGSVEYRRKPTIPEIGICWDFLTRLSIDRFGNVSPGVRYDPGGNLVLGNIRGSSLDELWNFGKRRDMKELHCSGHRKEVPYCGDRCEYWGIPISN
jgi:MoaA/NifB/PqqE/SkfB family radical SAM enzyme